MKNLEFYSVSNLESYELVSVNGGGDPAEGSYEVGNRIGKTLRFLAVAPALVAIAAWDILTN
ncbi:hypothetical protein D1816_17965 [Aquimarina sp. AD10]|uniref:hypothetical protein n=1 Tax=Aquimarina sp. AD10 TaxID=1714849 RepID=UPI000E4BCC2E|nr:hypothetical protein [Aquimarina sp. AD10]AXT62164.1 hypothetical protein D1816_17965 [Aquimarina sp. AD10]RKM90641.1 hypothetical protein D7033_24415 [Aquimarina sp. AD10]